MTTRMEQPSRGGAPRVVSFAVFALLALCLPGAASAQWTTGGGVTTTTNNVGIGTATPEQPLHVNGPSEILSTGIGAGFKFRNRGSATNADDWVWYSEGNVARLWRTGPGDLLGITTDGKFGIGTITPTQKLEVAGNTKFVAPPGSPRMLNAAHHLFVSSGDAVAGFQNLNSDAGSGAVMYDPAGAMRAFVQWHNSAAPNGNSLNLATAQNDPITFVTNSYNARMTITGPGNVGIGTTSPASKLHVAGDITVDGNINAKYQDVAEWVPTKQKLSAGTVVVLDPERSNHVLASTASYDTSVAGVISARPGLTLGEAGEGKALVATTGRIKVKVDASRAPIKIGDLIVTSDVEGVAMKSEPVLLGGRRIHAPGTIIGKALEPLAGGAGEILVLLSLQ